MKKSHRKDVIIARIIFAFIIIILVGLVACLSIAILKTQKDRRDAATKTTQTETEPYVPEFIEPETDSEEINGTEEETKYVWVTGNSINLREEANKNADVIKQVNKGDKLIYLGDEGSFAKVEYAEGKIGYVYGEYTTFTNPDESSEER